MLESYITMVRNNILRHFYVYNDGRAKESGCDITIQDFAGFYLFLAGEGWKLAKETNISAPTKELPSPLPMPGQSRRAAYAAEWNSYLFGEN